MTESFEAFTRTDRQARFSGWLRARAEPAWAQAVGHRFTRDLIQDYVFIDTLGYKQTSGRLKLTSA